MHISFLLKIFEVYLFTFLAKHIDLQACIWMDTSYFWKGTVQYWNLSKDDAKVNFYNARGLSQLVFFLLYIMTHFSSDKLL